MDIIKNSDYKKLAEYLEKIISLMPGHVYWKNREGVLQGCNDEQARSIGLNSRFDIVGLTAHDTLPKEFADEVNRIDKEVMNTRIQKSIEEVFNLPNGEKSIWISKKVPLLDENNEAIGLLGISFDITEKKNKEIELEKITIEKENANRRLASYLSTVSHRIINFVGGLESALKLLNTKYLDEVSKENLEICIQESSKVLPFIKNVTKLFEINSVGFVTKQKESNIIEIIYSVISEKKSTSKNIEIFYSFDESLDDPVFIDNLNLYKVLDIIIGNAVRFTEDGKKVFISAKIINNNLILVAKNEGKGIEQTRLINIFNAFPDKNDARVLIQSYGLKLSYAKEIINFIGGSLDITSQLDVDTTVTINFPVSRNINIETITENKSKLKSKEINKIDFTLYKILVVEDEILIRKMIVDNLRLLNINADSASSGEEALKMAENKDYDLIFMDLTLTGIDGIDTATLIKEKSKSDICFVAVSSHTKEEIVQDCLNNGFVYFIPKPATLDKFETCFKELENILNDKE